MNNSVTLTRSDSVRESARTRRKGARIVDRIRIVFDCRTNLEFRFKAGHPESEKNFCASRKGYLRSLDVISSSRYLATTTSLEHVHCVRRNSPGLTPKTGHRKIVLTDDGRTAKCNIYRFTAPVLYLLRPSPALFIHRLSKINHF